LKNKGVHYSDKTEREERGRSGNVASPSTF